MKLTIVAVGNKAPSWVKAGYDEYAKRFPRELALELIEIPAPRHHRDPSRFKQLEGDKMLSCLSSEDWVVALEEGGRAVTSTQLAEKLSGWQMNGQNVVFLVGGWKNESTQHKKCHDLILTSVRQCMALPHSYNY